jgi:hypothetical protein
MTLAFPNTRYTETTESARDLSEVNVKGLPEGSAVKYVAFKTRDGFRPIWHSADPLRPDTTPGISFGLGIRWPIVVGVAAGVVLACTLGVRLLRSKHRVGHQEDATIGRGRCSPDLVVRRRRARPSFLVSVPR